MVIDPKEIVPFLDWLLGPTWRNGMLFQPAVLAILLVLVGAAVVWMVMRVRKGNGSTTRKTGAWLGCAIGTAIVVVPLLAIAWMLLPEHVRESFAPPSEWANGLLGVGWYQGTLYLWLFVLLCTAAAIFVISWLTTALHRGPIQAIIIVGQVTGDAVLDIVRISPRRVLALARLAVKESIRRRVVVVFAVFIVLLLFAGWYLDQESIDPARLYLDFVLTATSYLVILLALFLSALSLPADFKSHTIYTVVTKPVRASEIVLGRIVGFTAIITFLLLVMGTISYAFVQRGLAHTHQLSVDDLRPVAGATPGKPAGFQGLTSRNNSHRHKVFIDPAGHGRVEMEQRHWHTLLEKKKEDKTYQLGPEEGMLLARVPVYGTLKFLDRAGAPSEKGINVGDEWMYRSFIEGGSQATAIWTFDGITPDQFPNGLPIEMTIEVFRTYKGTITKGVPGSLVVQNPKTGLKSAEQIFESKEFAVDVHHIPVELDSRSGHKLDLFKDLASDGKVNICLQCAAPGQTFGVARADMYLRASDASFAMNFAKGYLGIWLQALLVIAVGVMFSTFLSGPVAMIATLGTLIGGLFNDFMYRLATQQTFGGGPTESLKRLISQTGITAEMEPGLSTTVVRTLDQPAEFVLWLLSHVLPSFGQFSFSGYVSNGFDIPGSTILAYTCRAFAFLLPVFVLAYLCMKNREVAK